MPKFTDVTDHDTFRSIRLYWAVNCLQLGSMEKFRVGIWAILCFKAEMANISDTKM